MSFSGAGKECLEEGWAASVSVNGTACGILGLVREPLRRRWRMMEPVAVAEIAVRPLLTAVFRVPSARAIPAFPPVTRDVALILNRGVRHEDVIRVMRKHAPPELTDIRLFDIFTGKLVGDTRRSLAYSLVYQAADRTLTDEDANRYHEQIKAGLRSELGADIREN